MYPTLDKQPIPRTPRSGTLPPLDWSRQFPENAAVGPVVVGFPADFKGGECSIGLGWAIEVGGEIKNQGLAISFRQRGCRAFFRGLVWGVLRQAISSLRAFSGVV